MTKITSETQENSETNSFSESRHQLCVLSWPSKIRVSILELFFFFFLYVGLKSAGNDAVLYIDSGTELS